MFENNMCSHLVLCHQNPVTMHSEAFMPTKGFIKWLDTISTNKNIGDNDE